MRHLRQLDSLDLMYLLKMIASSRVTQSKDHSFRINMMKTPRKKEDEHDNKNEETVQEAMALRLAHKLENKTLSILNADDLQQQNQQQQNVKSKWHLFAFKFDVALLETLGRFCFIDLLACESFANKGNKIHLGKYFKLLENKLHLHKIDRSKWYTQECKRTLWPRVIWLMWLASCVHLILYMTRQYNYDNLRFRLKRVRWLNSSHPALFSENTVLGRTDTLEHQVSASLESLLSVGSFQRVSTLSSSSSGSTPHEHLVSYLAQCTCLLALIVSLLCYFMPRFLFKYLQPFDYYFIRNFLDGDLELRQCREQTVKQARLFIESSRSFTHALMQFSETSLGRRLFMKYTTEWRFKEDDEEEDKENQEQDAEVEQENSFKPCDKDNHLQAIQSTGGGESLSCTQLRQMLADDLLVPINQSSNWIARTLKQYASLMLFCIVYSLVIDAWVVFVLLYGPDKLSGTVSGAAGATATWKDALLSLELLFLFTICNIGTVFFATCLMFTCHDQIQLATELRKLIRHLVSLNKLRFYDILKPAYKRQHQTALRARHVKRGLATTTNNNVSTPPAMLRKRYSHRKSAIGSQEMFAQNLLMNLGEQDTRQRVQDVQSLQDVRLLQDADDNVRTFFGLKGVSCVAPLSTQTAQTQLENKMNRDLLLAIMHYRVFFERLVALIQPFGLVTLVAVILMFLLPLIGRLHLPYFLKTTERHVIVIFSCVLLIPVNLTLIGPAYMHRRCLDLYGSLNELLAHAVDITDQDEDGHGIFDQHLLSLLRKELTMSEGITPRFAVRFAGIAFTYPNLVRLHFYFGFVLLSILGENQASEQELTGSILSDPFGLF